MDKSPIYGIIVCEFTQLYVIDCRFFERTGITAMSDREIDEILEEIKRHSEEENPAQNEEPADEPVSDSQETATDSKKTNTIEEIIQIVDDDDEEQSEASENESEVNAESDNKDEANAEEIISIPIDDNPADETEENEEIEISIPKEEEESNENNDETVIFTIPDDDSKDEDASSEEASSEKTVIFNLPEESNEDEADEEDSADAPEDEDESTDDSASDEAQAYMSLSSENIETLEDEDYGDGKSKSKKPLIIAIVVVLIIALGAGIYFGFFYNKNKEEPTTSTIQTTTETTTAAPVETGPTNPLTGETGYNANAIGKRPVAVVVENEYSANVVRPQWGLNKADIVLEGESEYSTRLLLFWADYTNMPSQIGSARSARPPFIRFSQLFDAVFIHAGLSRSKGNYTGADTVFETENVDHVNLLKYSENGNFFGRDKSRTSTIEHTGYLNGTNTAELLEKAGINTTLNSAKFTELEFNETPQKLSDTEATSAKFIWSDTKSNGHCPKTGKFYYDESLEIYSTTDFDSDFGKADLEFENLIFLLDETEYIVKNNYKGVGNSETYCDYKLSGGTGTILSHGTALDIKWGVSNGKLWMKDESGNSVKLNPGKIYIGYGSLNKGGKVTLNYDKEG